MCFAVLTPDPQSHPGFQATSYLPVCCPCPFTTPPLPAPVADDMNMRLSSISQRLQLALSMIPIQKANVAEERLVGGAGGQTCSDRHSSSSGGSRRKSSRRRSSRESSGRRRSQLGLLQAGASVCLSRYSTSAIYSVMQQQQQQFVGFCMSEPCCCAVLWHAVLCCVCRLS